MSRGRANISANINITRAKAAFHLRRRVARISLLPQPCRSINQSLSGQIRSEAWWRAGEGKSFARAKVFTMLTGEFDAFRLSDLFLAPQSSLHAIIERTLRRSVSFKSHSKLLRMMNRAIREEGKRSRLCRRKENRKLSSALPFVEQTTGWRGCRRASFYGKNVTRDNDGVLHNLTVWWDAKNELKTPFEVQSRRGESQKAETFCGAGKMLMTRVLMCGEDWMRHDNFFLSSSPSVRWWRTNCVCSRRGKKLFLPAAARSLFIVFRRGIKRNLEADEGMREIFCKHFARKESFHHTPGFSLLFFTASHGRLSCGELKFMSCKVESN